MSSRSENISVVRILCVVFFFIVVCSTITCTSALGSFLEQKDGNGTVLSNSDLCCEGYTLLNRATSTVLIDMNGTIIHRWPSYFR